MGISTARPTSPISTSRRRMTVPPVPRQAAYSIRGVLGQLNALYATPARCARWSRQGVTRALRSSRLLASKCDAQPAIDPEHLPRDVGVLLAGKPGNARRDLGCLRVAAQWQLAMIAIDGLEPIGVTL